jgi:hypothetical protein
MPRMRPELTEDELNILQSRAEARFYRACREQLRRELLILHSVALIRLTTKNTPEDGEADFVVFDENRGFLVIEVKGGGISHDPVSGTWSSISRANTRQEIKDPFRQGMGQKREILRQIINHHRWPTGKRVVAGHAAFFPDIEDCRPLCLPHAPAEIIGSRRDLSSLPAWIDSVFNYWKGQERSWQPLGKEGVGIIEDLFCRPIDVRPLVSTRLQEEEVIRIRLTQQQARLLRALGTRKRAAICGGAGTGKTLLAVERAKSLATSGAKTLLLCYNRGLADHLKVVTEGHPNLHAMSFHQLCDWRIRVARTEHGRDLLNEAMQTYPGRDRFDVQLPLALALSTEISDFRYDAIVVDEGQDFRDEFWFPLMCLLSDENESTVYVFFDHNQAIYQPSTKLPIDDDPFVLTTNCRNTTHIHDAAYHYYKGVPTEGPEITGEPVVSLCAPSVRAQATRLHACITHLIVKEEVRPSDIAILVATAAKAAYYAEIKDKPLPQGFRWSIEAHRVPDSVLVDTVSRFKGLESAIVFLWGLQELQPDMDRENLYVGFSRAKSRLYLVGTEQICRTLLEYELESQESPARVEGT